MEQTTTQTFSSNLKPVVKSLLVCADLSCEFDLTKISQKVKNTEYNPQKFPGLILHIDEPKSSAVIFQKGKINIVGAKTENDAYISARKVGKILSLLDYNVKMQEFKITNITATCNCHFKVDLLSIASDPSYAEYISYPNRKFKSLFFKIPESHVTSIIHSTGRIIFTGAKEMGELETATRFIEPILMENQDQSSFNDYWIDQWNQYQQPSWQWNQYWPQYADWNQYNQYWQPYGQPSWYDFQPFGSFPDFDDFREENHHHHHHHRQRRNFGYPEWF